VVGLDNLNSYYDPALKQARLRQIEAIAPAGAWRFEPMALEDGEALMALFAAERPQVVVNLAAQAGVRYSLENPAAYIQSNLVGFGHILEGCRHHGVENLVYASSSSVYGGNRNLPFHEQQPVNHPVSLYAATKKANELMAHTYSHLYGLPATGLRFFTVYGPWGRPDMAPMLFARAILAGEPIKVFNHGRMQRDFTYIDDIVEGVLRCCDKPATANPDFDPLQPDPATAAAPHRVFNIGNSDAVDLMRFIELMEHALGMDAIKDFQPMQPGDVIATAADTHAIESWIGFKPSTTLYSGVRRFASWYVEFYDKNKI
jgi:UDP-glucuronate 4-epimerase